MHEEYATCRCGHVERADDAQLVQDEMTYHKENNCPLNE